MTKVNCTGDAVAIAVPSPRPAVPWFWVNVEFVIFTRPVPLWKIAPPDDVPKSSLVKFPANVERSTVSEPVVAIAPPSDDEFDWNVDVFTATSVPAIAPPWPKLRPFVNEESRTRTDTPPRKPPLPNPASPSSNVDDRTSILLALTTPPSAPPVPLFTKCEPVIETSPSALTAPALLDAKFRSNREPWIVTSSPALMAPGVKRDELSVNVEFHTTTSPALIAL